MLQLFGIIIQEICCEDNKNVRKPAEAVFFFEIPQVYAHFRHKLSRYPPLQRRRTSDVCIHGVRLATDGHPYDG